MTAQSASKTEGGEGGYHHTIVADQFGVRQSTISAISTGRSWTHDIS